MKQIQLLLVLFIFSCFPLNAYCVDYAAQTSLNSRIKLATPDSMVNKANRGESSFNSQFSEIMQNPLVNSTLNSYNNMLQGSTGASYNTREQIKQQVEYSKQQAEYVNQMDSE